MWQCFFFTFLGVLSMHHLGNLEPFLNQILDHRIKQMNGSNQFSQPYVLLYAPHLPLLPFSSSRRRHPTPAHSAAHRWPGSSGLPATATLTRPTSTPPPAAATHGSSGLRAPAPPPAATFNPNPSNLHAPTVSRRPPDVAILAPAATQA